MFNTPKQGTIVLAGTQDKGYIPVRLGRLLTGEEECLMLGAEPGVSWLAESVVGGEEYAIWRSRDGGWAECC